MNKRILMFAAMVIAANSILFTGCFNNKKVTGMKITPYALMIRVDSNNSLSADIEPIEAIGATINWSISDPSIAEINKLDDNWVLIQPKAVGEAVVTAKTKKGDLTSSAVVIIKPVPIDDDYATQIPGFYFGNTKINDETIEIGKLITVKYHDRNKMVYSIDGKFKLSRTGNEECSIKVDYITDVSKTGSYTYKADGEIEVTINGKLYPATIEGVFSSDLELKIKIKDVPELGNVTINFQGYRKDKVD
jgi:uncharacterized lipoprotein YajG